jgi:hypothetical protein
MVGFVEEPGVQIETDLPPEVITHLLEPILDYDPNDYKSTIIIIKKLYDKLSSLMSENTTKNTKENTADNTKENTFSNIQYEMQIPRSFMDGTFTISEITQNGDSIVCVIKTPQRAYGDVTITIQKELATIKGRYLKVVSNTHVETPLSQIYCIQLLQPILQTHGKLNGGSRSRKNRRNKTRKSRKNRRKSVRRSSKKM